MPKIIIRGKEAGKQMGRAIIEMVHLMYQNNTAKYFYLGLIQEIQKEMKRRKITRQSSGRGKADCNCHDKTKT